MDPSQRIIARLPLEELWLDDGFKTTSRRRQPAESDIAELLRAGQVQFVVADVGSKPRWIELSECYRFWKNEVKPHLADPKQRTLLEAFPDSYCYFASEWGDAGQSPPIIVLEKHH